MVETATITPARVRAVVIMGKPGEFAPEDVREVVHELCTYHTPTGDMPVRFGVVSAAIETAIVAILGVVPPCADRTAAVRSMLDARMVFNRAVSLDGIF